MTDQEDVADATTSVAMAIEGLTNWAEEIDGSVMASDALMNICPPWTLCHSRSLR